MNDPSAKLHIGRVEYIRFAWNPEEEPRLLEDYRMAVAKLAQCEHCLGYELARSDKPGHLLMRIEWDASAVAWPLNEQPAAVRRFLLALKTALKTVVEVDAFRPVNTSLHVERKPVTLSTEIRKSA